MTLKMLLVNLVYWVSQILTYLIIADAILTWIPSVDRNHPAVRMLRRITEPIYRPFRRIIPPEKTGYLDLSPMIAIFAVIIIGSLLQRIILGL